MSSRNAYLSADERAARAGAVARASGARARRSTQGERDAARLVDCARATLHADAAACASTTSSCATPRRWQPLDGRVSRPAVLAVAAFVGEHAPHRQSAARPVDSRRDQALRQPAQERAHHRHGAARAGGGHGVPRLPHRQRHRRPVPRRAAPASRSAIRCPGSACSACWCWRCWSASSRTTSSAAAWWRSSTGAFNACRCSAAPTASSSRSSSRCSRRAPTASSARC